MYFEYELLSEKGIRSENQDNALVTTNNKGNALIVLADGMGGHIGGKTASSIAVRYLKELFKSIDLDSMNESEINKWCEQSVDAIRNEMILFAKNNPRIDDMGTTLVFALVGKDKVYFTNIGDSRAYIIQNKKVRLVTKDQNYINSIDDPVERKTVEMTIVGQYLVSSLGPNKQTKIDNYVELLDYDTTIILTSDGIHKFIPEKLLHKIIISNTSNLSIMMNKLIRSAKKYNSTDNMTGVVLRSER